MTVALTVDPLIAWLMIPGAAELPTLPFLVDRPEWMRRGACRGVDQSVFFPPRGVGGTAAKAICAECSVRGDCLAFAMDDDALLGTWGGTSSKERQAMRRAKDVA
jgi:WhiB family redox-sensing transcriptional regulator